MKIFFTVRFKKNFKRLPAGLQKKTMRNVELLASDLRHPGVRAKKMSGVGDIWEGRVDRNNRLTFEIQEDTLVFRRVGPHDILKKTRNFDSID